MASRGDALRLVSMYTDLFVFEGTTQITRRGLKTSVTHYHRHIQSNYDEGRGSDQGDSTFRVTEVIEGRGESDVINDKSAV